MLTRQWLPLGVHADKALDKNIVTCCFVAGGSTSKERLVDSTAASEAVTAEGLSAIQTALLGSSSD